MRKSRAAPNSYKTYFVKQWPENWQKIEQALPAEGYRSIGELTHDLLRRFLKKVKEAAG